MENPSTPQLGQPPVVRRTTRSALAEIPARLSLLSVDENVTPTGAAGTLTGAVRRPALVELQEHVVPLSPAERHAFAQVPQRGALTPVAWSLNVNVQLPSSYMSPAPSPDELVIQQRGRRRGPLTWSPDVDARKREGPPRTPSPAKTGVVLRSTPRKRLLLSDPKDLFSTPEKMRKLSSPSKSSPTPKKGRVEKLASNFSGPLSAALKGLSNDQLVNIIQTLLEKHPNLEEEVREIFPSPDLRPLEERLSYLKKNIYKSLPNSRLTSKTDSPAYSRAATHLDAFKKSLIEQGRRLVESGHWDSVVDYVCLAWSYVRATPLWDNPPHNAARKQCFKSLAAQCMAAIKRGQWTAQQCDALEARIEGFVADSDDIQLCIKQLDLVRKKQ